MNNDILIIEFPIESKLVTIDEPGSTGIKCEGLNGVTQNGVGCVLSDGSQNILEIHLKELTQKTGLYKLSVENIRNPPSLRGSSKFRSIRHVTDEKLTCSTFDADVFVENEFASALLNLNSSNIV